MERKWSGKICPFGLISSSRGSADSGPVAQPGCSLKNIKGKRFGKSNRKYIILKILFGNRGRAGLESVSPPE